MKMKYFIQYLVGHSYRIDHSRKFNTKEEAEEAIRDLLRKEDFFLKIVDEFSGEDFINTNHISVLRVCSGKEL